MFDKEIDMQKLFITQLKNKIKSKIDFQSCFLFVKVAN